MNEDIIGWGCTRIPYKRLFWKLFVKDTMEGKWWMRYKLIWNPSKKYKGTFVRFTKINPQ